MDTIDDKDNKKIINTINNIYTITRKNIIETINYFTEKNHWGSECYVPSDWCKYKDLMNMYSLSSFSYCAFGIFFLYNIQNQKPLYKYEWVEGYLWIWQGLISYQCDAVNFGVRSISHPIDRISATLLTI